MTPIQDWVANGGKDGNETDSDWVVSLGTQIWNLNWNPKPAHNKKIRVEIHPKTETWQIIQNPKILQQISEDSTIKHD